MSPLTRDEREYLRAEIARRAGTVECPGCGERVELTARNRRYCSTACANRHWHVRKRAAREERAELRARLENHV